MPTGVYKRTKKLKHSGQFKKGFLPWNKGTKGLVKSTKPMLGKKHSEETKRKMSESRKGHNRRGWKVKEDAKSKIKGRKLSEETKIKMGLAHSKEKHWNWQGGISPENKILRHSREYKLWRTAVFERDNYTCVFCFVKGCKLNADHIKPFAYFPELRFAIDNGRTLCEPCHKTTDTYMGRAKNKYKK